MTTKRKDDVTSVNPPALYKIEFPNGRGGMYSLRPPFKNVNYTNEIPQHTYLTKSNVTNVHPEYLHMNQSTKMI